MKENKSFSERDNDTRWAVRMTEFLYNQLHTIWIEYTKQFHAPNIGPTATQHRLSAQIQHLQTTYEKACLPLRWYHGGDN